MPLLRVLNASSCPSSRSPLFPPPQDIVRTSSTPPTQGHFLLRSLHPTLIIPNPSSLTVHNLASLALLPAHHTSKIPLPCALLLLIPKKIGGGEGLVIRTELKRSAFLFAFPEASVIKKLVDNCPVQHPSISMSPSDV